MTSRLIVKNLPKNCSESKLRQLFEEKGTITDIQLKYTKDGVFRQFAFIGYEKEDEAKEAIKFFNNSFVLTTRIKVEQCSSLGSDEKPKSWSKHASDSNAYRKIHGIDKLEKAEKEKKFLEDKSKKKNKNKIDEIVGEHKNDPDFKEFMKVHDKNRSLWANDDILNEIGDQSEKSKKKVEINDSKECDINVSDNDSKLNEDEEDSENHDSEAEEKEKEELEKETETNLALKSDISDGEYMKSLMCKNVIKDEAPKKEKKVDKEKADLLTIKIHNIPFKTKKPDILKFFKPLKPFSVRIPKGAKGFCYVGFKQENDFKKAMLKDKSFIKGKQVYFINFTEKNKISKLKKENSNLIQTNSTKTGKWAKQEEQLANEEDVSESGKIFFRNLAYTICEDDIQNLFEEFGPIAEISLPIDSITRKIKGFGTVTFVMPEHAVQAFNKLDGSTFHGRLLHLIPGKSKDTIDLDETMGGLSFKDKKFLKLKKSAGQAYNWNTLFMGGNAVADFLASKFNTSKETILDTNTGGSSAAVRLALGETQVVMEMKKFLEDNDVQLDVFDTTPIKRSKTVIIAKNLPAETKVEELSPLFSKFGLLGRLVLPPSGITAIIEFLDPSEAKKAFYKLAYSKFKYLPLYLEWAPENVFKVPTNMEEVGSNNIKVKNVEKNQIKNKHSLDSQKEEFVEENMNNEDESKSKNLIDENNDEPPEDGTTLFLKNLSFSTREDTVKNHFKHLGPIHLAQVAMRRDPKNPKNVSALGYGFIQFKKKATTELALKEMQFTKIEGSSVELKRSDRTLKMDPKTAKKKAQQTAQTGSKILIRNIPFQAQTKEIFEIFKPFGELRSVRLPKKLTPGEQSSRGFGFVDFLSKSDAKNAFDSLSGSTHLYGRRLVLEWAKVDENDVTELRKRTAEAFRDVGVKKMKHSGKAVFDSTQINEIDQQTVED